MRDRMVTTYFRCGACGQKKAKLVRSEAIKRYPFLIPAHVKCTNCRATAAVPKAPRDQTRECLEAIAAGLVKVA
jgi:hypothetical protein